MAKKLKVNHAANAVTERANKAIARKKPWESRLKECYDYMMPSRNSFDDPVEGSVDSAKVYDSTAQDAITRFAAMMQSSLTPPWQQWGKLVAGREIPVEQKEDMDKALSLVSETVMKYIWYSNFDSQALEMYYDLGISTGAMLIKDTGDIDDPIIFEAVPLAEVFPEEGANGTIETVFRKYKVTSRNIPIQWPDATISEKLKRQLDKDPDMKNAVIEGVIHNPKEKNYSYVVLVGEEKIYEFEYDVSPWVVPRMDKRAGEVLGRGAGYKALDDVRTLNLVKQYTLMNAEMAVSNIYTVVDDGVLNPYNIELAPNSLIPVKSNGGEFGASISPLPRSGDFNVGQLVISDLRDSVYKAFFVNSIGNINDPVRSATEVMIRNQESLRNAGAFIGRLQTEFIEKLIRRVYSILNKYGLVPNLALDGRTVAVQVDSPLSRARKQEEVNSYMSFLQAASSIHADAPALLVKPETLVWLGENMGVPRDLIPTTVEIKETLQSIAQNAQQQLQAPEGVPQ